jgi:hypothetical protein
VRTTIDLPDDLLDQARRAAVEQRRSLARLVQDALRLMLRSPAPGPATPAKRLPTFKGRGLRPGVHLDDSAELLDLLEGRR